MRKKRLVSLAVSCSLTLAATLAGTSALALGYTAKVMSVPDGDTINVSHDGTAERIILFGADAPEIKQPGGEAARTFTDEHVWHKMVTIDEKGRDDKGRIIAMVYLPDGTNLNKELIRQGLAWWSDKYAPDEVEMKKLHDAAKAQHIGLWSDPNPIAPWIWRNGQRNVQAKVVH